MPGGDTPAALADICAAHRGEVLCAAPAEDVEVLEPGSLHTTLLIARFAFDGDLDAAWARFGGDFPAGAQALAAPGLPWIGWPGSRVPTIASVVVPAAGRYRC